MAAMRPAAACRSAVDLGEHYSWDGDLRQLERDKATVAGDLRADLDQFLP